MKKKNIGKMALAVALSTSFLAGNMADVYAEDLKSTDPIVEENKDSESIATNAENAEENYKKAQEDEKKP